MRLLVTGGCGFVGSNFLRYVLQHYGPEMVTNVDALTTGRLVNVAGIAETHGDRYEFLHADLADAERIEAVLAKHQFYAVVHCAAEGCGMVTTASLLDRARHHGIRRFLVVSRDRENSALTETEERALGAYREHGQEVVITRASNNYGPFQQPAELVPATILHALRDEPVPIPGDGSRVRDWLHVEDHCAALFAALLDGQPGAIYHLKSGHELRDIDLAHRILQHLGKSRDLVQFEPEQLDQAGVADVPHTPEPLAWKPRHHFEPALGETIDWYVHNREWWEALPAG
jgi:dTDP-glucose 4,6-dehydratase